MRAANLGGWLVSASMPPGVSGVTDVPEPAGPLHVAKGGGPAPDVVRDDSRGGPLKSRSVTHQARRCAGIWGGRNASPAVLVGNEEGERRELPHAAVGCCRLCAIPGGQVNSRRLMRGFRIMRHAPSPKRPRLSTGDRNEPCLSHFASPCGCFLILRHRAVFSHGEVFG